jgi:hypothetical protein
MKTSVSEKIITQDSSPDPAYDNQFTVYPPSLTQQELEEVIVFERLHLYNSLKPCGAAALHRHLRHLGLEQLPSVSTIQRVLTKRCLTNCRTGYYREDYL